MPRPIWNGHITFGLVNIPVNLYSAERRTDLELHMLDSRDHRRVRYERVNEDTGEEVPWKSIVRGYEYSDGNFVVLSDKELKGAAPEATRSIDIEAFVPLAEIDPLFFDRPYYLEPAKNGAKGYALLREALRDTDRVGIAKVVIRTRQYISALMVNRGMLVLMLLRYAQELRSADDLKLPANGDQKARITPVERKTARMLVDSMAASWDPKQYHDEYRGALMKWIQKKVKAGKADQEAEVPEDLSDEAPAPVDFMELLKKSLAQPTPKQSPHRHPTRHRHSVRKKPVVRRKAG